MSETVSDFLVRRLKEWGVQRLYGYSGDGINGDSGRAQPRRQRPGLHPGAP